MIRVPKISKQFQIIAMPKNLKRHKAEPKTRVEVTLRTRKMSMNGSVSSVARSLIGSPIPSSIQLFASHVKPKVQITKKIVRAAIKTAGYSRIKAIVVNFVSKEFP
jgi:hypothetical protein